MGKYFLAFLMSLTLHLSIIALFVFSIPVDPPVSEIKKETPVIIEATILDESVVTAKANELKQQQEDIKRLQQKQQEDFVKKLEQEKQDLQQLKAKRQQEEQEAKKQAEQLQIAAQEEQKKLQDIKQKLALEKKKQQEIDEQRRAEEKKREIEKQRKEKAERIAEEKRQLEAAKIEAEKQKKIAEVKKLQALKEKLRLDAANQEEQNRILAENARIAEKETADATALIKRKITQNWNRPGSVHSNLKCKIRIGLIASGDVMSVVIVESSGNPVFDDSAERAVRKASPLPVPKDPNIFQKFRSFNLEFAPDK